MKRIKLREWRGTGFFLLFGQTMESPCDWHTHGSINGQLVTQWTGLKDKDGIDIYEGDFIEQRINDNGEELSIFIYEVIYEEMRASFLARLIDSQYSTHIFSIDELNPIKIIGNIYQNPELFEGKS